MLRQGSHTLPAVRLPHEALPTLSAATTGGQPHPIGAPSHVVHWALMSRQPLLRAIPGVPHIHVAIIAPADQPRPIRTPGHTRDSGQLRVSNPAAAACGHIPHLYSLLIAPTSKAAPVGTPVYDREDGIGQVRVLHHVQRPALGRD